MSQPVYSADQIKAWDAFTLANEPVTSIDLMERAATACAKQIIASHSFQSVAIFCGTGNNGGDGLVIARLLANRGIDTTVYILDFGQPTADFKINKGRLPKKVKVIECTKAKKITLSQDLIIDAIFGSGLNREPAGWIAAMIRDLNASGKPIVAVDIPSGLFADDNRTNSLKNTIRASQTITFQSPKMAFLHHRYAAFTGKLRIVDIGLAAAYNKKPLAHYITKKDIRLKTRETFSHKGNHGFLCFIGGFEHWGAAVLCAGAALRSGAGYVGVYGDGPSNQLVLQSFPECLILKDLKTLPAKTSAIAIGPGLGTSKKSKQLLEKSLRSGIPLVIDADAINLLAANKSLLKNLPTNCILTPHPLELERLIGKQDSPEAVLEKQVAFSKKYNIFIIQKGAYSKLTTPAGQIFINSSGNPGMASAGMGDVLTGIIGSLLAQGYSALEAAQYGMYLHGYAADLVKRNTGERGMIASDVIAALPKAFNSF